MKKRYKSYKLDNRHVELEIEDLKSLTSEKVELKKQRDGIQAQISQLTKQRDEIDQRIVQLEEHEDEQEARIIYLMNQQDKTEVIVNRVRYYLSKDKTKLQRELILPPRS